MKLFVKTETVRSCKETVKISGLNHKDLKSITVEICKAKAKSFLNVRRADQLDLLNDYKECVTEIDLKSQEVL